MTRSASQAPQRAHRGAFTGRTEELAALDAWRRGPVRPCVLRGVAGIGKTRLALEFAALVPDAVVAPVGASTVDELVATLALALGVELGSSELMPCYALLGASLDARGDVLLVLDACEAALTVVCAVYDVLARVAPRAKWLCTAQRAPGLVGALVIDVGPMTEADARALFERRVEERREVLTAHDLRALPALLRRLDCVPLAIELAAGRVGLLDVAALRDRIDARLTDHGSALDRALRTSWSLVAPEERRVLRAVALFPEPVAATAVERVVAAHVTAPPLDLLQSLIEGSWLGVRVDPRGARLLVLLDQVRAFVCDAETLEPAVLASFVSDHLALARRVRGVTWRGDWPALMEASCASTAGMLAALRATDAPDDAATLALALSEVFDIQGLVLRTGAVLDASASVCERASPELAFAVRLARVHCERYGSRSAWALDQLAAMEPALDVAAPIERVMYCNTRSALTRVAGDFQAAVTWAERGMETARRFGLRAVGANTALSLGAALWQRGDREASLVALEGAWREATAADCPVVEAAAALNYGELLLDRGRLPEAACVLAAAEGAAERLRLQRVHALVLQRRSLVELELGHLAEAERMVRTAEARQRELGLRARWVECLGGGVLVAMAGGRWREAIARCDEALAAASTLPTAPVIAPMLRVLRAIGLHHLGDERGAAQSLDAVRSDASVPTSLVTLVDAVRRVLAGEASPDAKGLGFNERMALRLSLRAAERGARRPVLRVHATGQWFERAGAPRVSLEERPTVARVLAALAGATDGVDVDGLLRAGWPGPKPLGESGAARVYDAIRTLRKLGLADAIVRDGGRYRLHPAEPLELVQG